MVCPPALIRRNLSTTLSEGDVGISIDECCHQRNGLVVISNLTMNKSWVGLNDLNVKSLLFFKVTKSHQRNLRTKFPQNSTN